MGKLIKRLLVFFIGIPLVYAIIFLFPFKNHLLLNIVVIIFSAVGALEFSAMLEKKLLVVSKAEALILGAVAPLSVTLYTSFKFPLTVFHLIFIASAGWILISQIFTRDENMDKTINRIAGRFSVIIYPGIFMSWLIMMSVWENSGAVFLFLIIIFGNDSIAWLFGSLFGKNSRGIVKASPNKSITGFIAGFLAAVLISAGTVFLFPFILSTGAKAEPVSNLLLKAIILGFCTSIFANLGDLCESAIKRSCGFDDSGKLMLGRGGVLDSIDSIAVAAPVYFALFNLFF